MIDLDGGVAQRQLTTSARRLRALVASLRAKADEAEHLLDTARALDTRRTWQGEYPDRVRGTLDMLGGLAATGADAVRERADFLESVAMDYELTAEEMRSAESVSPAGCR